LTPDGDTQYVAYMTDEDLLEAQAQAFGSAFVLVQHLTRRTDDALEAWGLTTRQWLLLAVMQGRFPDASPSLTEAAALFGTTRQNVKQIASALESRGYLRLVADPRDARSTRLEPTARARAFDEPEGRAQGAALLADAFAGLSSDQVIALRDLLHVWLDALSSDAPR
jgi:DNA-binding MarR family transcriptional regulator